MVRFETDPLAMLRTGGLDGLFRVAETLHAQLTNPIDATKGSGYEDSDGELTVHPRGRLTSDDDGAELIMLIPGFAADHLEINVERASVTVAGKNPEGLAGTRFERKFQLPFPADADAAAAFVENGILKLGLPRLAADKPKTVKVSDIKPAPDSPS